MNIHNKSLVGKQVDRRAFLVAAGTASAITMGYGIVPMGVDMAFAGESGKISPSLFFDIHGDGQIVVHIAKAEMGQHVGTALAQVLIEELEADWDKVELSYVSFNPAHGLHITGGSWSVNWTFDALSRAGAAGRIALIEAAATKLGGKASDYSVSKGVITGNGKTISYGEIAASGIEPRAFSEDDLKALKLKAAGERKLVGQSVEALDIPDKTRGKATYGIDAKIDGMVYATPAVPPVRYGAKVISVDDSEAKKIKGYERFVTINDPIGTQTGLVMAIANSYWAANQASLALKVEYDLGPNAKTSLETIHAESARLIKTGEATRLIVNDGDADAAIKASDKTHTATYTTGVNIH
ncbi:MAG: aldehyde dehydrogenase, partial [Hyphomicrobiales bacterium]